MTPQHDGILDDLIAPAVTALVETPAAERRFVSPEEFAAAAAVCRRITARNSRTFYLASAILPREKRRDIRCLYAFCRTTDDIVDKAAGDPAERLRQWERRALGPTPEADNPVLIGWHEVRNRYGIPDLFVRQLITAVGQDMARARYETFRELAAYCYGVASTVGLMSMRIIGYAGPGAVPYAIKLGLALQLTNILRDVGEDWKKGRLYLPAEDMERFGVSERQIAHGVVDDRWRELMRFEIARNRALYAEAWPGIALLHSDGQFPVAVACRLYAGILDDIERNDYQVFGRRSHVSDLRKLALLPSIWLALRRLRRGVPPTPWAENIEW